MFIYRILISLIAPLVALWAVWTAVRGRQPWACLRERFGFGIAVNTAPHIWLHAASNGELASARPVLDAIRTARPDLAVFITCNSISGRALAQRWGYAAACAPVDLRWAARRVLARRNICALITLESELWPNRHVVAQAQGVPVIMLGARLSAGTAKTWGRFPRVAARMMAAVRLAAPQDEKSAKRLQSLGMSPAVLTGVVDFKSLYQPQQVRPAAKDGKTWLAASTHEGEEAYVIAAHIIACSALPGLRLILAIRHPRRAAEVGAMLTREGIEFSQRSAGGMLRDTEVLLADTLGEMAKWYDVASVAFVGGSLTDRGGHTPYEPLAHGVAVIHGANVRNFDAAYMALDGTDAQACVQDADQMARQVQRLLPDAAREEAVQNARAALHRQDGVADAMAAILALLPDTK